MDELRKLAQLKAQKELEKRRQVEIVDKPEFRLADPNNPVKLRTRDTAVKSPSIEKMLTPEQINELNQNWERKTQEQRTALPKPEPKSENPIIDNSDVDLSQIEALKEFYNTLRLRK